ncbi:MAG: hypothetical protein KDA84_29680, partial [Planctomycetaceae bacterium]|nr:hypothetical protein [Planctomycetaceae bacterium]
NEISARKFEPVGKKRLGWYHTHPTQGLFFSSHDHDVHQIFRQPYQFGLVIDPRVMEAEAYFWMDPEHRTQTDRSVRISLRGQSGQPRSTKSKRSKQARTVVDQSRDGPLSLWDRCQELWKELLVGFAILVLVVLIWVQRSKGDSVAPKHTDKSHSPLRLTHP